MTFSNEELLRSLFITRSTEKGSDSWRDITIVYIILLWQQLQAGGKWLFGEMASSKENRSTTILKMLHLISFSHHKWERENSSDQIQRSIPLFSGKDRGQFKISFFRKCLPTDIWITNRHLFFLCYFSGLIGNKKRPWLISVIISKTLSAYKALPFALTFSSQSFPPKRSVTLSNLHIIQWPNLSYQSISNMHSSNTENQCFNTLKLYIRQFVPLLSCWSKICFKHCGGKSPKAWSINFCVLMS